MKRKKKKDIDILGLHDRDLLHHAILLCIVLAGFAGIYAMSYRPVLQFAIGAVTTLLYVGWGVFHHYLDGDLHVKNVIEYVLLGILGILILWVQFL